MFDDIYFLQKASRICFGLAIAFLLLSILLFFLFNIREVILIETGRAQRRTILEMNERNQRTGKLREDTVGSTGATTKKNSGKVETAGKKDRTEEQKRNTLEAKSGGLGNQQVRGFGNGMENFEMNSATVNAPQTAVLQSPSPDSSITFIVTRKTIITHTDESIPV